MPVAEARVRLLSGGNMQKLILGRVMANDPAWFWPTSPRAGWMWGPSIMCMSNCWRRANAGAAILLISEDLDELLSLSDRVAVMFRGQLSDASPRESTSIKDLGLMMAGQGFKSGEQSHAA